jgi:type II secretory pathway pseudopilin PulG
MFSWISIRLRRRTCQAAFSARQAGLTIVEAVGMTVILGLMAGLSYPAISGLRQSGLDQQAVSIAQTINQAQQTYELRVPTASTQWGSALDSPTRYGLIWQYVPYATAALTDYEPSGYTFALGLTLDTKVVITGPGGATVSY